MGWPLGAKKEAPHDMTGFLVVPGLPAWGQGSASAGEWEPWDPQLPPELTAQPGPQAQPPASNPSIQQGELMLDDLSLLSCGLGDPTPSLSN
jgi:hypothetical protein